MQPRPEMGQALPWVSAASAGWGYHSLSASFSLECRL